MQLSSIVIALKMARKTKFNSAWILSVVAMLLLSSHLVIEFIKIINTNKIELLDYHIWSTLIISISLSVGIFYMEKVIWHIDAIVRYRKIYDKKLLSSMIQAEEGERQRIAKDLHDGLGPLLSSAKMSISYISKDDISPDTRKDMLTRIGSAIDESIGSIREISNNLSPSTLTNFGLVRSIALFVNRLPLPPGIEINFKSNIKQQRFDHSTEMLLYRICSELINNALKHSGASVVNILLNLNPSSITLNYIDNGRGFDLNVVSQRADKGIGLSNIESRVTLLDGTLKIDSNTESGTSIIIEIPNK